MDEETVRFMLLVRDFVAKRPDSAAHIATFVQAGINDALDEARERAADMEVALVCATSPGFKKNKGNQIITDKLLKWRGRTSCAWEWLTDNPSVAHPEKS